MTTRASRRAAWLGGIFPALFVLGYGLALWLMPYSRAAWFHSEYGPVENGTALAFLTIGILAAHLAWRLEGWPRVYRAWFALFAVGGVFMCLEEISYGQTFFQWESPQWFVERSKQDETNLHNLYGDSMSRILRRVAEAGLPVLGIVLPLALGRGPRAYKPGHISYAMLPRWEMAAWIVLAVLVTPLRRWLETSFPDRWSERLSETKELLWSLALLVYILTMRRRLLTGPVKEPVK
jgi:hypothetical protein